MTSVPHSLLRDVAAAVIIAIACPIALFGGSMVGCLGQEFNADCAMTVAYISPVMLIAAGFVAGLVTRGWTGMMLVLIGLVIGLTVILMLSFSLSRPVNVDPISGLFAAVWFLAPITIGYGLGRLVSHLTESRDESGSTGG